MPPFTAPRSAVRVQKTRASFWWPAVWGLCWSMCALSVWTISANTEVPVASEKTIASAVMKAFMAGLRCCLHDRSNDVTIDALAEIEREAFHTIHPSHHLSAEVACRRPQHLRTAPIKDLNSGAPVRQAGEAH